VTIESWGPTRGVEAPTGGARPFAIRSHKKRNVVTVVPNGNLARILKGAAAIAVVTKGETEMARSKRGSDENLFSISGAATALSRSRRTISKPLDGVKPDAIRHGLPLWRMQTIVDKVNTRTQAPIIPTIVRQGDQVLTGVAAQCAIAFEAYHRAEERMEKLAGVEERRVSAREELGPLCREAVSLMRQHDTDSGLHEEHVDLRADTIYRLMVRGVELLCGWTSAEAWGVLDPGDDEDEEAA
jgi:hypothetical protein